MEDQTAVQPTSPLPEVTPPPPKRKVGLKTTVIFLLLFLIAVLIATIIALVYLAPSTMQSSQNTPVSDITGSQNSVSEQPSAVSTISATPKVLSDSELLSMADDTYKDGNLPLGDNKYTTSGPKKGYIYLCRAMNGGGGAQHSGSWITGMTWNYLKKISVQGSVTWSSASFSTTTSGSNRVISGNGLPINHTTGTFPIQSSDPAYAYDRNPNTISAQSYNDTFPLSPTYSDTPNCMGGEVGIMLSGVALFNGFDADMRDAAAYEVQDSCNGHPEKTGEYHYHSLSSCFKDISVKTILGYALDGFPITGPMVAANKYLTTDDLDECHGITSDITVNGKAVTAYHYVMTRDFPYSVSCFRGRPVSLQIVANHSGGNSDQGGQTNVSTGSSPQPPQVAYTSCQDKSKDTGCSFSAPRGTVTGTCQTPPGQTKLVCVPTTSEQNQGQTRH